MFDISSGVYHRNICGVYIYPAHLRAVGLGDENQRHFTFVTVFDENCRLQWYRSLLERRSISYGSRTKSGSQIFIVGSWEFAEHSVEVKFKVIRPTPFPTKLVYLAPVGPEGYAELLTVSVCFWLQNTIPTREIQCLPRAFDSGLPERKPHVVDKDDWTCS